MPIPLRSIEAHRLRLLDFAARAEAMVLREVEAIVDQVTSYISSNVQVDGGEIVTSQKNFGAVTGAIQVFDAALVRSSISATATAVVKILPDQIGELAELLDEGGFPAEGFSMGEDDIDLLRSQARTVLLTLDAHIMSARSRLSNFLSLSTVGTPMSKLIQGVSEGIRRVSEVKPIIEEQSIVFFRMAGSLFYSKLEQSNPSLGFEYVGPEPTREFCGSARGKRMTLREIRELRTDKQQHPLVLGGGFGCKHWWFPVHD